MGKNLKGMTLVEVITALGIIFIVAGIAYAGICTGGNLLIKATDMKNESIDEAEKIDKGANNLGKENVTVKYVWSSGDETVEYTVSAQKVSGDRYVVYQPVEKLYTETTAVSDDDPDVPEETTTVPD